MIIIFAILSRLLEEVTLVTCSWEADLNNYCPA